MATSNELRPRQVRTVYMITYSQANDNICSTRQQFADNVLNAFDSVDTKVIQWVCCIEKHQDGGNHFHMAVKLDKARRWIKVKQILHNLYGMVVHFSCTHVNYFTAWQYVTKADSEVIQSDGHPNLSNDQPSSTTAASTVRAARASTSSETPKKKKKRLNAFEVTNIVRSNNIQTRTELLALAEKQRRNGKTDLAEFIAIRGAKCVADAIQVSGSWFCALYSPPISYYIR